MFLLLHSYWSLIVVYSSLKNRYDSVHVICCPWTLGHVNLEKDNATLHRTLTLLLTHLPLWSVIMTTTHSRISVITWGIEIWVRYHLRCAEVFWERSTKKSSNLLIITVCILPRVLKYKYQRLWRNVIRKCGADEVRYSLFYRQQVKGVGGHLGFCNCEGTAFETKNWHFFVNRATVKYLTFQYLNNNSTVV